MTKKITINKNICDCALFLSAKAKTKCRLESSYRISHLGPGRLLLQSQALASAVPSTTASLIFSTAILLPFRYAHALDASVQAASSSRHSRHFLPFGRARLVQTGDSSGRWRFRLVEGCQVGIRPPVRRALL